MNSRCQCKTWSNVGDSKEDFLDYLEFFKIHLDDEGTYEEIIGWSEEKVMRFVQWWNWDLNQLKSSVKEFVGCYIEKENDPASEEQSHSRKIPTTPYHSTVSSENHLAKGGFQNESN